VSNNTARALVLIVGVFMFAAIGIKRDTIPDPFRFAWAAGVILLGLSLLADISPQVAGPLAILVLIAVYWRNRGTLGSLPGLQTKTTAAASSGA
jgi:hypothetical protein